ncbi:hypothetical protein JTE90_020291 [Oedothorax gibbosus]|uniref:Prolactin receptor n=1 Tax=Oedothorax gibbosus TaxID=931172 RepID=A0AAV6VPZ8_9ARAC|nr:hypothetical protein JTE90_020291 [Oedothorax gibbosus]
MNSVEISCKFSSKSVVMQHIPHPWNTNCVSGNVSNIPYDRLPEMGCLPPTNPISVSTYVTTSSPAWAHTVPSPMPWMDVDHRGLGAHYFSAPDPCTSSTATSWELLNHLGGGANSAHTHLKRKGDATDPAPQKICVTEERMTARFQDLHITNRFTIPTEDKPVTPPEGSVTNLNQLDHILKDCENTTPSKSLVLAPELKKLVEPEKIFASTFLSKVERPSMALVLWQPNKATKATEEESAASNEVKPFLPSEFTSLYSQHLFAKSPNAKPTTPPLQDVEMDS